MLKRVGYDEALIVKGCTHVALWCCALISLAFVAIWFTDILTLQCYSYKPIFGSKKNSYKPCIYEAVGVGIFFACFRDSVRMIAHFDDNRQRVLLQKWRALELLRTESQQALESAKENVERLRRKVVEMMKERVEEYAQEVFTIVLPCLHDELQRLHAADPRAQGTAEFEDLMHRLTGLLRDILQDVEELASGMLLELAEEHPEAYSALRSEAHPWEEPLLPWDAWLQQELPALQCRGSPRTTRATLRPSGAGAAWPLEMELAAWSPGTRRRTEFPGSSSPSSPRASRATVAGALRGSRWAEPEPATAVARSVMQPVEELLATPERFEHRFERLLRKSTAGPVKRGQRMGWGTPPWETDVGGQPLGCRCCVPRFMAIFCTCATTACCACCCCCPGLCGGEGGCCRSGFDYAPKRLRIGCFWLQIHTKLHERLLQGLLFSIAYCCFYFSIVVMALEDFEHTCPRERWQTVQAFRQCVLGIARKCFGLGALLCYIPAMSTCIYHIDRLDAVMETMETIWELEDVQKAIRAFHRSMVEVEEQVVLLRAIEGRVLARIDLVMQFGRKMGALAQPHVVDGPHQLRSAMEKMVERLEVAAWQLRPVAEWLAMSPEAQEACVRLAAESLDPVRPRGSEADGSVPRSLDSVPLMDTGTFTLEES